MTTLLLTLETISEYWWLVAALVIVSVIAIITSPFGIPIEEETSPEN